MAGTLPPAEDGPHRAPGYTQTCRVVMVLQDALLDTRESESPEQFGRREGMCETSEGQMVHIELGAQGPCIEHSEPR